MLADNILKKYANEDLLNLQGSKILILKEFQSSNSSKVERVPRFKQF